MLLFVQVWVCCSKVCGEASSVVSVKAESASILLTLTLLLDTQPVMTCRFMRVPLCLHVCVCVCERALVSWPVVFAESRWMELVSHFFYEFCIVGHFPKALAFFLSLSFFFPQSFQQINLNRGINIRPLSLLCFFLRANTFCISPSLMSTTNHSPNWLFYIFVPSRGPDEGWPGALSDFQELIKQEIIGEAFSQKHTFSKTVRRVDLEAFAMEAHSK